VRGRDVYYTCIPSLWLLRDADGDGRAELRRELATGFGVHVGYLGHDMHGLRIGPDGKLYFSIGDRGLHVETPRGVLDMPDMGGVLRCNLDGSDLEIFATGLRNPQELAFDAFGNLFTVDNNSDGGDEARIEHIVEGGDSGWRFHWQWITEPNLRGPWNDEKLWYPHFDGQAAYIVPPVANLTNGPSGLTVNPGTSLPAKYDGHFFVADFRGEASISGIQEFALSKKGASFSLASASHFVWGVLATDCDFAPDGALYITDWVEGWNKTGKGRLYRAFEPVARSSAIARETQKLLYQGMDGRSSQELLALLAHSDQRVRQDAQLALASRGPSQFDALLALAADGARPLLARVHAAWALGIVLREHPEIGAEPLVRLLADKDDEMRAQAVHVLGDLRFKSSSARFVELLADVSPRVRLYAAIALARAGNADAVEPLFALARDAGEGDPMLRYAAIHGLEACAPTARLVAAATDPSAHARIAAIVALRRRSAPEVARFLDDRDPRAALEAARAVYDVPIRAAFPALADLLKSDATRERALSRRILNAAFQLGGDDRARDLDRFARRGDAPEELRAEAESLLAQWREPPAYDLVVGGLCRLPKRDGAVLHAFARTPVERAPERVARAWVRMVEHSGSPEATAVLLARARDAREAISVRAEALHALAELAPAGIEAELRSLGDDPSGDVRAAALGALHAVAPKEAMPLIEHALRDGELAEKRVAYAALAGITDESAKTLLAGEAKKLSKGLVPAELALDLKQALEAREIALPKSLQSEIAAQREAAPEMAPYLDSLFGGDAQAGRALFRERQSLSCVRCHRVQDSDGMGVGPDLRGIGRREPRLSILESIVKPNARIAKGYESTVIFLQDDTHVDGRVLSEDAAQVHMIDANGNKIDVERSEIASRKTGLSAMPDGLKQYLTPREMRDLIEYLATL
jgi:quinoprotein glucose dehydrogenase